MVHQVKVFEDSLTTWIHLWKTWLKESNNSKELSSDLHRHELYMHTQTNIFIVNQTTLRLFFR